MMNKTWLCGAILVTLLLALNLGFLIYWVLQDAAAHAVLNGVAVVVLVPSVGYAWALATPSC